MTAPLKYASLFAGIGGFDLGFDRAGMTPEVQVELNPQRRTVLARHWSTIERGDDVKSASARDLGEPDVAVGGFPCKDLSIGKGNRLGLAGDRSGLYWEFHRLVDEYLRLVDASRPRWAVLENVPGLLTSNDGRDLAAVLLGMEQLGYGWAYRVVDGRSWGLAAKRPRVIIIFHRGGDPRPAWAVLADESGGGVAPGLRGEQADSVGPVGPRIALPDGVHLARKSSRPRATAAAGGYATWVESDFLNVLTPNDGLNVSKAGVPKIAVVKQTHLVSQGGRLRGLTPMEWERAMGFPDGWTAGIPDAERYYALGDAFPPPMAEWLGRRLAQVTNDLPLLPEAAQR